MKHINNWERVCRVGGGMGHAGLVMVWGMQGWWWHGACRVGDDMGHAGLVVAWGMQGW